MNSLLRRIRSAPLLALTLALVVITFLAGAFVGHYRSRRALTICKAQNLKLAKDLGNAINRGITLETTLNLCKEKSK